MMRARERGRIWTAPPFQYHPQYLVYQEGTSWHSDDLRTVARRIMALLPAALHPSYRLLCKGATKHHEDEMDTLAQWFAEKDSKLGFRIPNIYERMIATGQFDYLKSLQSLGSLTGQAVYDMVGNHFDADALILRIFPLLWDWARGAAIPKPPPALPPARILCIYQEVAQRVRTCGLEPSVLSPFPSDVLAMVGRIGGELPPDWALTLAATGPTPPYSDPPAERGTGSSAAGDGRGSP